MIKNFSRVLPRVLRVVLGSAFVLSPLCAFADGDISRYLDTRVIPVPVGTSLSVAATKPLDQARNVPRAQPLFVKFSVPVNVVGQWFTLNCGSSGAHTVQVSGGPVGFTLTPDQVPVALEACVFTIVASQVQSQADTSITLSRDVVGHFTDSADLVDYYAGVDSSSGPALKAWLHNRIKDHTSCPYTSAQYNPCTGGANTWVVLNQADQDPNNTANILDIYKNASYTKIAGGTGAYNREHTWPNSLGFGEDSVSVGGVTKPNPPYTDTHMLYLSDTTYNSNRGNRPLAALSSVCPTTTSTGCTGYATVAGAGFGGGSGRGDFDIRTGSDGNTGRFEIWDHRKGDIARAVMYMAVRYKGGVDAEGITEPNLELTDTASQIVIINSRTSGQTAYMGLQSDLLAWNDLDPPDAREQMRDEVVYSYQHNRNPFVDHPEWAHCIFENVNCPLDTIFADTFDQ